MTLAVNQSYCTPVVFAVVIVVVSLSVLNTACWWNTLIKYQPTNEIVIRLQNRASSEFTKLFTFLHAIERLCLNKPASNDIRQTRMPHYLRKLSVMIFKA